MTTPAPKCACPANCKYCGRRRSRDTVGHYCKTKNCQWQHGYKGCLMQSEKTCYCGTGIGCEIKANVKPVAAPRRKEQK